jgi:DNA-binding response OmpR family regulator
MSPEQSFMIVDDDPDLLFLLKKQFEKEGFKAFACLNGKEIINELIGHKTTLLLLDISMGAVSGKKICEMIRADKRVRKIKILMMSGNADIDEIALDCGADGYITKPLDIRKVKEFISEKLSG